MNFSKKIKDLNHLKKTVYKLIIKKNKDSRLTILLVEVDTYYSYFLNLQKQFEIENEELNNAVNTCIELKSIIINKRIPKGLCLEYHKSYVKNFQIKNVKINNKKKKDENK